jgi:flagellar hook-associated protein 2
MSAFQVGGLVSGLDTNSLIDGLLALDQARVTQLQSRQRSYDQDLTAFQGVEAKLLALQSTVFQLGRAQNNAFDGISATSSDESQVTAAADHGATPGIYTLQVNSLAKSQMTASQGFDSASSAITQGTLQIKLNSGATTTITIDSTNNTLQGLASAINAANAGVTASIVNDGSDSRTQPYRLLLTATNGGTDNGFTIVNNLAADSGSARRVELGNTYVNNAVTGSTWTGTSAVSDNAGSGNYTGASNNTYTFTVANGGTVGTDNGITLNYTDSTGQNTGTITLNSSDAGVFKNVAQGIQVQFGTGTLVAGQTFAVDAFVPSVQQAVNASVTLGSGGGSLTVQSDTNTINNLISGVTLNLKSANPGQPVTINVANDTSGAEKAITDFVSAYNDVMKTIDGDVAYDPGSKQGGPLLGDTSVLLIQDQVRSVLDNVVPGLGQQMNRLGALGITTDDNGYLVVDSGKLERALNGQTPGVSLQDIRSLFALGGSSNNPGIQFITGADKTNAKDQAVQVNITQAATQASITATNALAASTVIDGTNNQLTLTVDGVQTNTITLGQGTYSQTALAQELQAEINKDSNMHGRQITVTVQNGHLVLTSAGFGSSSQVTMGNGTALGVLGFTGAESSHGQDVQGNFVVSGKTEAATGVGQLLTGDAGNANTEGLTIRSTLSQSQLGGSPTATVTLTRGLASQMGIALNGLLDPVTGRLKTIEDSFKQQADDVQKQIDEQNQFIDARRQALIEQFVNLETTISQLQGMGGLLSGLTSTAALLTNNQQSTNHSTTGNATNNSTQLG